MTPHGRRSPTLGTVGRILGEEGASSARARRLDRDAVAEGRDDVRDTQEPPCCSPGFMGVRVCARDCGWVGP